jgi:hypothetical protein
MPIEVFGELEVFGLQIEARVDKCPEDWLRLFPPGRAMMDVNETEHMEMTEESGVRSKVIHEIDCRAKRSRIDVGEMDHSPLRGEIGDIEGKLVDEIAARHLPGVGSLVGLHR